MGLDMYLIAVRAKSQEEADTIIRKDFTEYTMSNIFNHNSLKLLNNILTKKAFPSEYHREGQTHFFIAPYEEVGYWRKANHIHAWFVETIQYGVDNCEAYHVTMEQLDSLYELCLEVLKHPKKAPDILPTQEGFFFGNTEYGEGYMYDIERTIGIITLLRGKMSRDTFLYYRSSW